MDDFKHFTILYIEDDIGVREVNFRILKRMFKETYCANDGEMGYELYLEHKPDIILSDIKMPKLDGIDLAKKIRSNDDTTKIIITTAFSDEQYLIDAVELGIERYIVKPLTKRNLIPALQKAISKLQTKRNFYFTDTFYYNYENSLFFDDGKVIEMTKKELLFLTLLVKNSDKIITYTQIEREVWGDEYMSLNSLRTTLGFLRKKIPVNIIKNISNMGYKLKVDSENKA